MSNRTDRDAWTRQLEEFVEDVAEYLEPGPGGVAELLLLRAQAKALREALAARRLAALNR